MLSSPRTSCAESWTRAPILGEPGLGHPKVADTPGSVVDQAAVDELVRKSNEKIEKLRDRVKLQKEVSRAFRAVVYGLAGRRHHQCFSADAAVPLATREGRPGAIRPATAAQGCRAGRRVCRTEGSSMHLSHASASACAPAILSAMPAYLPAPPNPPIFTCLCVASRWLTDIERPQAVNDQMLKNLQRENAMIATAWYDLTSRLQSNHVVLQRRQGHAQELGSTSETRW